MSSAPNELVRLLEPLLPAFQSVAERWENADWREPESTIHDLVADLKAQLDAVSAEAFTALTRRLMQVLSSPAVKHDVIRDFQAIVADMKRNATRADSRASLIVRLINEAHARVPLSPMLAVKGIRWIEHCNETGAAVVLERADRPRDVARAIREIVEYSYQPYLRAVWALWHFRRAEWPLESRFGPMNDAAGKALAGTPFASLLEPLAVRRRDAIDHGTFEIEGEVLRIWSLDGDRDHPDEFLPLNDARAYATKLHALAHDAFWFASQVYLLRQEGPAAPHYWTYLNLAVESFDADADTQRAAEQLIEEDKRQRRSPLFDFVDCMPRKNAMKLPPPYQPPNVEW